jgi:hypothetical protein
MTLPARQFLLLASVAMLPAVGQARWAECPFAAGETNKYRISLSVTAIDQTNGVQFTISMTSPFTNTLPKAATAVRVHKLSTGELPQSNITFTGTTNSVICTFVVPTNELGAAEFMWSRGYEGQMQRLGGCFYRINLKGWYDYHRTKLSNLPRVPHAVINE